MNTGSGESQVVAGRYRLDSHLGSGGMGTVWRGWDERLRRHVAVKEVIVTPGLPEAEEALLRERYLREARATARLRHPSVVGVYDVIPESGRVWIVMELINAVDLAAILRTDGPLDPVRAAKIGVQLVDALNAAHEAGVLHRDVKPANVLIGPEDRTVLTDFGVASVSGDPALTRTGQLVGSPAYVAPERLTGGTVGPASDVWSLGCTLYAAVEGKPPFHRPEQFAIIAAITVDPVPPALRAGLLAPVLYGMLEKDQADRWDSTRVRAALERVAAGLPVVTDGGCGSPVSPAGTMTDSVAAGAPVSAPPLPVSGPPSAAPTSGAATHMDAPVSPAVPAGVTSAVTMTGPPRRKRRWPAVLLSLLALAAVGAGAGWIYLQERAPDTAQTQAPSVSPSPVPTGAPVTEEYVHPTLGFRLRVPSTWSNRYIPDIKTTRFNVLSGPGRTDPKLINATNNLYVAVQPANGRDAVQLAEVEDRKWSSDPAFVNYQQLRLGPVSLGSHQGSLLEFTYYNSLTGPRHVVVFRTVVKDTSYEVSLNGPAPLFEKDLGVFDDAVDSLVITAA